MSPLLTFLFDISSALPHASPCMKLFVAFSLFLTCLPTPLHAGDEVVFPKNNAGYAVKLSHMTLTPRPAEQRSREDADDAKVLSVRLLASDATKHSKPLILPLRFDLAEVDQSAIAWSPDGTKVAVVLKCWKPGGRPESHLLLFSCQNDDLHPLPLPDVATRITAMQRDIATLSLEYVTTVISGPETPTPKAFGWIGGDQLAIRLYGDCKLADDIGETEGREVHGSVVFQVTKEGAVTIKEVVGLRIQG